VSRKVAKEAVDRNRIRRQWYEIVRTSSKISDLLNSASNARGAVIVCVFIIRKIKIPKAVVELEVLDLIQRALDRVDKARKI
jgi:ribonuclease P protein component